MNTSIHSAAITLGDTDQIGLLRKRCIDAGITGLKDIAKLYESLRLLQSNSGTWCYENYTQKGSDSFGVIESKAANISKPCIIWSINHYLGLNRNSEVIASATQALKEYGTGSGTSAMSGGHNSLHKKLEERLASSMGKEAALLFPTGYTANLGAISGLSKIGNSAVFFDRECHASIIDGIKLAGCKFFPFKHNNIEDLQRKLDSQASKFDNIIVIVESVYSMSGEEAPLAEIVELKKQYPFYLFVDEAHAFGLYDLGGLAKKLKLSDEVDFVMTTLSKSTASIGGVVATSREFMTLLQVEANAYLFQAAIPPSDAATILAALEVIDKNPDIIASVWEKTGYFRRRLIECGFDIGVGKSPIIPVYIRDSVALLNMGREMIEHGVFTTSVAYPVVKHSEVRFRFIVNNSHTYDQINHTIDVLLELGKKYKVISS